MSTFQCIRRKFFNTNLEIWLIIAWARHVVSFVTNCSMFFKFQSHIPFTSFNCSWWNIICLHWWWIRFTNLKLSTFARSKSPFWWGIQSLRKLWIVSIRWWEVCISPWHFFLIISIRCTNSPLWVLSSRSFIHILICSRSWDFISTWFFKGRWKLWMQRFTLSFSSYNLF